MVEGCDFSGEGNIIDAGLRETGAKGGELGHDVGAAFKDFEDGVYEAGAVDAYCRW